MTATTCATCRFWEPGTDANPIGTCRRNAPVMPSGKWGEFSPATWPLTWPYNWCGEWEVRA